MPNYIKVQVEWAEIEQPNIGGYALYYDTVNHASDADIVANATKVDVGKANAALIDGLAASTQYFYWLRWEYGAYAGAFSAVSSFTTTAREYSPDLDGRVGTTEGNINTLDGRVGTAEGNISTLDGRVGTAEGNITTLDADLTVNEAAVAAITTGTGGNAVVDETKFSNLKKPAISSLQPWPLAMVTDDAALKAIPKATADSTTGLTVYVRDRHRTYFYDANATKGYVEPNDKVNKGVDPGWWVYAVDEDPEHYGVSRGSISTLTAIPIASLYPSQRVFCRSLGYDLFWSPNANKGEFEPDDKANKGSDPGWWVLADLAVQRSTVNEANQNASSGSVRIGEVRIITNLTNAPSGWGLAMYDGTFWIDSKTGSSII